MANPVKAVPEGQPTITPSLTCKNAAQAIEFYKTTFDAKELMRMETPGGSTGHCELLIGNSKIMLADEFPGMSAAPAGCKGHSFYVYVQDCDAVFNRAVAAGAKVAMPLTDQFWGDRYGTFTDPFGHNWASPRTLRTWRRKRWSGARRNGWPRRRGKVTKIAELLLELRPDRATGAASRRPSFGATE